MGKPRGYKSRDVDSGLSLFGCLMVVILVAAVVALVIGLS